MDERLIVYKDTQIYTRDLNTLSDDAWVGDMIIAFQMRLLEAKYPDSDTVFILPPTVKFIQTFPLDTVRESLDLLNLQNASCVFLPLADIDRFGRGATHWSLLSIERTPQLVFNHFDSMGHSNRRPANHLTEIMANYFEVADAEVTWLPCPSQGNSYDCGVYVMAYMDMFLRTGRSHQEACQILTPDFITQYRRDFRGQIVEMASQ
jgi:Ulp1 family protease